MVCYLTLHCRKRSKINLSSYIPVWWDVSWFQKLSSAIYTTSQLGFDVIILKTLISSYTPHFLHHITYLLLFCMWNKWNSMVWRISWPVIVIISSRLVTGFSEICGLCCGCCWQSKLPAFLVILYEGMLQIFESFWYHRELYGRSSELSHLSSKKIVFFGNFLSEVQEISYVALEPCGLQEVLCYKKTVMDCMCHHDPTSSHFSAVVLW